jgi:threonine dehydrogenase-like Zn-dependent dehydrogenase
MQAAYYVHSGLLEIREVPEPTIETSDDIVVEVEVAGLCGTDLHIVSVPQLHPAKDGIVLGHEFVGRVVAAGGAVRQFRAGDRIVAGPNIPCGQCRACRKGRRNLCGHNVTLGITMNGGFARFARVPVQCAYPVPEAMEPELAIFAEPLSCVLNGFSMTSGRHGKTVVLGAGAIGLYFLRVFRHFGALELFASEPVDARREAARKSGATCVFDPTTQNVVAEVLERTRGGADLVVDTTGSLVSDALAMLDRGGMALMFGLDKTVNASISTFDIVRHEKRVVGCFANNDLIPAALDLIPSLGMRDLITHRFPLDAIEGALSAVREGTSVKALLDLRTAPPERPRPQSPSVE